MSQNYKDYMGWGQPQMQPQQFQVPNANIGQGPTLANSQGLPQAPSFKPGMQDADSWFDPRTYLAPDGSATAMGSQFGDMMGWGQSAFNIGSGIYNMVEGRKQYKDGRGDIERNFQNQEDLINFSREEAYLSSLANRGIDVDKYRGSDAMKEWKVENRVGR